MIGDWLASRRKNAKIIRQACDLIADEFKALPYSTLADPNQPLSYRRMINGIEIGWMCEIEKTRRNGDLCVSMDFYSPLPTLFGGKPSYRFLKGRDESVN